MRAGLSLGAVLYHWPASRRRDFYARIADEAPVDVVTLGEVVCAKRAPFARGVEVEAAERLRRAGKEVVVATLALVGDERDLEAVARVVGEAALVEANDATALARLRGRAHVVGPFVNAYNRATLDWLTANGARRVALSAELDAQAVARLALDAPVALEVQAFGRLPLALSARCYRARAQGLAKDGCRYVCGKEPEGLIATTIEGVPFVTVNGTQTMTVPFLEASEAMPALAEAGVALFRLWPQDADMVAIAAAYRDLLDGRHDAAETRARIAALLGDRPLGSGLGFGHGEAGRGWLERAE